MKRIVLGIISLSLIAICGVTIFKVLNNYQNNLIIVSNKRIIEAAKNCYYEAKCKNEKITLDELYINKYLSEESNPITKEIYNKESYVEIKKENCVFIVVN